jgi:hypothetical protein
MKKCISLLGLLLCSSVLAERWDKSNNPHYFDVIAGSKLKTKFNQLPAHGALKDTRLGWSESYWPSNLGGISYRWNHPNPQPFKYKYHTKAEIFKMNKEQLSQLSPAELYDISQGDYSFGLTKKVRSIYTPKDLWWEGICHGWALAASNYPEPDAVVVKNKDGISVPFGASDVKGLLSMHDAFNSKGIYARVGDRCSVVGKVPGEAYPEDGEVFMPSAAAANRAECADVNAGAFHVVLSNMIAIFNKGFVADIDRFNDVWNQPVVSYKSQSLEDQVVSSEESKNGIARKIRVVTEMSFGDALDFWTRDLELEGVVSFVSKNPVTSTPAQVINTRRYEYVLELNFSGEVVGGSWISDSRPDMLWMKIKDPVFRDGRFPLAGLNEIYRPIKKSEF